MDVVIVVVVFLVLFGVVIVLLRKMVLGLLSLLTRSAPAQSPNTTTDHQTVSLSTKVNDNELATFRISVTSDQPKSKNTSPGKWIPKDQLQNIGHVEIKGGLFYTGGRLPSQIYDGDTEASLVDPTLKIESMPIEYEDDSLGYWPKFISISPQCRGAYINWLASHRDDPNAPLGYVFIYFYGMERRVLVDARKGEVADDEFVEIFKEVLRLKSIFGSSRSFAMYAARLLEIMVLFRPKVVKLPATEWDSGNYQLLVRYQLARLVTKGAAIPARLALLWLHHSEIYQPRTPAKRCYQEFGRLFIKEYTQKWGQGLVVKPNRTRFKIDYRPASSTLRGVDVSPKNLVDPSQLKGPMNKLIAIADTCTVALESYSRYLGKKDNSRDDIAAMLLLPDTLISTSNSPLLKSLYDWGQEKLNREQGLVTVAEFFEKAKQSLPEKFLKKDLELVQGLMQKIGFGFAPDPRYHNAKPTVDGKLVLFPEGHGEHFEARSVFVEVAFALRLGVMVANSDGHIDDNELITLHRLIDHNHDLSPIEQKSLHAYLKWRVSEQSNSMTGLATRLKELDQQGKTTVAHILVKVALADGRVEPDEIIQLEKMYKSLGFDKAQVSSDIHSLASSRSEVIQTPAAPAVSTIKPDSFSLDEAELARHESETQHVQTMLGAIFSSDDSDPEITEEKEATTQIEQDGPAGLDAAHSSLYRSLISKDNWSRDAVENICRSLGLMVDGAIETINDWAFDQVDAPLIDEDGDFFVDLDVAEELSEI